MKSEGTEWDILRRLSVTLFKVEEEGEERGAKIQHARMTNVCKFPKGRLNVIITSGMHVVVVVVDVFVLGRHVRRPFGPG